ncbi:subtilisin-like serine protease [Tulasnella sp. 419]|nr:subtilisin-like serine protease [Tulasnella sp. 418]KAG8957502.1 subtilisin-like serine protease [Tulasnella sp. 419]
MSYRAEFYPCDGPKEEGSYIVKLRDNSVKQSFMATCSATHTDQLDITHSFEESNIFNGFVAKCSEEVLDALRNREDVEYITEDAIMRTCDVQSDTTWGLHRISHSGPAKEPFEYNYPSSAGEGVNVYVLDTGIFIGHSEFEGRARNGRTFYRDFRDQVGHGTHCAGTILGKTYGVAKKAEAIAVRVLGPDGSGTTSNIIAGIDWVISQHSRLGKPSIISMSLGGPANQALDDACNTAADRGIFVVVAAGNDNRDARNTSPARAANAFTVGAIGQDDSRARFSNFGDVLSIWAPGVDVLSAGITGPDSTDTMSGTSMATPHVAGVFALYISENGANVAPAEVQSIIKQNTDTTGKGLNVAQVPKV